MLLSLFVDAPAAERAPAMRLDHLSVWVTDVDATAAFLEDVLGWKRHPLRFGVSASEKSVGALDLAFVDANGFWLELVAPTAPGPAMEILEQRGDGAFVELAFQPSDYDATLAAMRARGIGMRNMDGTPLAEDGGRIAQSVSSGGTLEPRDIRIAYWPRELSRGTDVEIFEYRDHVATDVFTIRNRSAGPRTPVPGAPRVDRIAIIVRDAEATARFYTDVVGLQRAAETFTMDGGTNARSGGMKVKFVDAGGVWLALVQPVGPGPLMDYLDEKGDGFIAELIVEVDDLDAFYDRMRARGITMVDTRGEPLDEREKAHVLAPFGDRIAYFPVGVSRGMVIEVSQRGPRSTSLIHRRDRSTRR